MLHRSGSGRRGAWAWYTGWRVRRLTGTGHRKIGEALDAIERAVAADAALAEAEDARPPGPQRPSGRRRGDRLRSIGVGLIVANAVAVVVMLIGPYAVGTPASTPEVGVAVLLGALLAGGQLAFAVAAGRRLHAGAASLSRRIPGGSPARSVPFEGVALALLGTLVGWVVYVWTRARLGDDQAQLGVLLGITLALQAWIAPWLLVAETAAARTDMLDRRVREIAAAREFDRSTACLALTAAHTASGKVEHLVAMARERHGRLVPASWAHALLVLDTAIAEADARYALDLAGGRVSFD